MGAAGPTAGATRSTPGRIGSLAMSKMLNPGTNLYYASSYRAPSRPQAQAEAGVQKRWEQTP